MIRKVKEYIEAKQLLPEGERLIIGVSGGADSIALLDVLTQLGYECIVAHCNFHLRGEESNRDEQFVRQFCEARKLQLEVIHFETESVALVRSISIEMAARELRYNWFESLRKKYQVNAIAVAHHKDDSVETILLNLVRGTGIRGLTGISAKNGYIIRPFLTVSRAEIMNYIEQEKLSYVNDYTNLESIYSRNKIRLDVLPLLETINPSAKESILKTANYLSEVENIYKAYIEDAKKRILRDNEIDISMLKICVEPKTVLFEILYPLGFNSDTVSQIYESLNAESGRVFYSLDKSAKVVKDRNVLLYAKNGLSVCNEFLIDKGCSQLNEPIQLKIEELDIADLEIAKDRNVLLIDADKIQYPLLLRRWRQGDWFIPFGMKGRKKLSDYFSDNKFSLIDKEQAWLLCSGEDIIWLVGHRSDERYRITQSTKTVLKITLIA